MPDTGLRRSPSSRRPWWLLVAWLPLCLGCGPRTFPISGTVSFDGEPLTAGTITFEPADGRGPTAGGEIAAGRYEVAAPTAGDKRVRIFATRPTGRRIPAEPFPGSPLVEEIEPFIPDVYNARTTLGCSVATGGPTVCDFHMKSP